MESQEFYLSHSNDSSVRPKRGRMFPAAQFSDIEEDDQVSVSYCQINQDCTCVVVGTKAHGFQIYQLSPFRRMYSSPPPSY